MAASTSSSDETSSEEKVLKMKKDNAVSTMFRVKAEKLLLQMTDGNVYEIISNYNKAVACAVMGSSTLALAFAGRSRIASNLEEYRSCLFNIKMAKRNNYPVHKLGQLLDFEERMIYKLENKKKPKTISEDPEFFRLSHPKNDNFPFMIDAIQIEKNSNGYYFTTSIPLKCGDIVAIEKTFTSSSLLEGSAKKCANCNKYSLFDLLPCEECCSGELILLLFVAITMELFSFSAMFCSMRCYSSAKKGYHSFECGVIDMLKLTYDGYHIEFLLLKPLFKALAMFQGSVKYLRYFLSKTRRAITMFDLNLTQPDKVSEKDLLNMSMILNCSCPYTNQESNRREIEYAIFMRLFPKIKELMKVSHHRNFLFGFMITQSYGLVAQSSSRRLSGTDGDFFGSVSALKKYMTHSCVPNIHSFVYENGGVAHVVQNPIPAGGQLTTCHT